MRFACAVLATSTAAVVLGSAGCEPGARDAPKGRERAGPVPPPPRVAQPPSQRGQGRSFVGTDLGQDRILELLRNAPARRFKPVGTTSIVFQMRLDAPLGGTFEPRTRRRPDRHRAEIAAYRLARLLELDNVPPAVTRHVARGDLRQRLAPDYRQSWDDIEGWTRWEGDRLAGAAVHRSVELRNLGLEQPRRVERWSRWLDQSGAVPQGQRTLAADLSAMIAFDYVIANWQRLNGGKVQGLPSGRRVLMRGNDVAFDAPLPEPKHDRILDNLQRVERFPRALIVELLALDEAALRRELARDPGYDEGELALGDRQIEGVMERRAALLSYVGALIREHGEARVLAFP